MFVGSGVHARATPTTFTIQNIGITTCLEIDDFPTKSMVLSSKITKRTSENFHLRVLISDLIDKGQPSCPTSSGVHFSIIIEIVLRPQKDNNFHAGKAKNRPLRILSFTLIPGSINFVASNVCQCVCAV